MKTAVLIPCFNEATTVAKVVIDFHTTLPEAEIYVFDNNSTDSSAQAAAEAGATVIREPRRGKGFVVRSMFSKIDADIYVVVDADDTYPAEAAPSMIGPVADGKADMVVGDRLSTTYFDANQRAFHNFGNRLVRSLINLLFRSNVRDVLSGYRVFSREFVKNFPVQSEGFEIETEMTIHALDRKYNILELPVDYRNRPTDSSSKLNTVTDGFRVLRMLTLLFKDYKPLAFFTTLAILILIPALLLLIPVFVEYWQTGLVPRFPTLIVASFMILTSILLVIAGLILNTIAKNNRRLCELLRLKS